MSASPFNSISNLLAFDSRDWSTDKADAWLWGIVFGWDDEDEDEESAMPDLQARHGWPDSEVERLRQLHRDWDAAKAMWIGVKESQDARTTDA